MCREGLARGIVWDWEMRIVAKLSQVQSLWNGNKWGGGDWGFWAQLVLYSKESVGSKYLLVKNICP